MQNVLLKQILTHTTAILVFLLLSCIYFYPQLEGKVLLQSDLVQWRGMSQEVREIREKTGEEPLWTNAMFGGMPTYQINTRQPGNLIVWVERSSRLFIERPIGDFFVLMLGFYVLMILLGVKPWLGIIGAVAFGFSTNNLVLMEAGHVSKLKVIAFIAPTVAGVIMAYRKKFFAGAILFAVGLAVQLVANHVQMTYYLFLCLAIYGVVHLVETLRRKAWPAFAKATGFLVLGGILALGSSASLLWTTYEYSADTMRGDPILEVTGEVPQSSSETSGLEWEYAMRWSNGLIDVFACVIPGVAGGGAQEPVSESSATSRDLRQKGAQLPDNFKAPLYWGALPFTSGPVYFGAGVILLFVLGLIAIKSPLKWWLSIAVLVTILLSMGKHFAILNEPIFDHFPLYNKFRAPSSILSVTSFLVPILSFLALAKVFGRDSASDLLKNLKLAAGITGGVCLVFAILGPSLFSFSGPSDAELVQSGYSLDAIIQDRKALMRMDALRSLAIILVAGGLMWLYLKQKIGKVAMIAGIGLLTLVDLWGIGKRYVGADSFADERRAASVFEPRAVDRQIMDQEPHRGAYRVLDLSVNTFNSASISYFHNTIGGYHAAKLQRYQDMIDRHISRNNVAVLNMLNCKYIITTDEQLRVNEGALGNAWFVEEIDIVPNANAEIDALNGFDPSATAIVHQDFRDMVSGLDSDKNGSIALTSYAPDYLVYQSNSAGEQLAVFSEIWYGPDKGWQAYIDGQPVEHLRVNYILRALRVPAGGHIVEFRFRPQSYYQGKAVSLVSSILILLAFLGYIAKSVYDIWKVNKMTPAPTEKKAVRHVSAARTSTKRTTKKKR